MVDITRRRHESTFAGLARDGGPCLTLFIAMPSLFGSKEVEGGYCQEQ